MLISTASRCSTAGRCLCGTSLLFMVSPLLLFQAGRIHAAIVLMRCGLINVKRTPITSHSTPTVAPRGRWGGSRSSLSRPSPKPNTWRGRGASDVRRMRSERLINIGGSCKVEGRGVSVRVSDSGLSMAPTQYKGVPGVGGIVPGGHNCRWKDRLIPPPPTRKHPSSHQSHL